MITASNSNGRASHTNRAVWILIVAIVVLPRILNLDIFLARDELTIWRWADEFSLAVWELNPSDTPTGSNYPGIPMYWVQTIYLTLKYKLPAVLSGTETPVDQLFSERNLEMLSDRRLVAGLFVSLQILLAVWLVKRLFAR